MVSTILQWGYQFWTKKNKINVHMYTPTFPNIKYHTVPRINNLTICKQITWHVSCMVLTTLHEPTLVRISVLNKKAENKCTYEYLHFSPHKVWLNWISVSQHVRKNFCVMFCMFSMPSYVHKIPVIDGDISIFLKVRDFGSWHFGKKFWSTCNK